MRRTLPLIVLLALLAGCAGRQAAVPPTATPAPTAPPATATTAPTAPEPTAAPESGAGGELDIEAVRAAIQQTLDDHAEAYNTGDAELLRSTVDQSNAPFRRLVQEQFTIFQNSIGAGSANWRFTAGELTPRELGFVQAQIQRQDGFQEDWLFREVDGRWLLSEPTERQLGERYTFESENFIYEAYHWSDDVNQTLAELMEQAREQVIEVLGKAPEGKYTVRIRPIFGLVPPSDPGALAWYASAARPQGDRMQINAPGGYHFSAYDPAAGWEELLYRVLVHEYTHLVNQRSFMPIASMRDWMYEGLAEYVAGSPRAGQVSAAVQSGRIIPIIDETGGVTPQDLDHLYLLERDVSLAYGLSYSLVAYIVEEHGGLDTLWALAQAMNETPGTGVARYDGAMQAVLGLSYEEFDAGWREWLQKNY